MALPSTGLQLPLGTGLGGAGSVGGAGGAGGAKFRAGGRPAGGTRLVVVAALVQLLGFAIPVVTSTSTTGNGTAYEFQWIYETFRLQAPGLLEWVFYLPAAGIAALSAAFLPTRFLRPVLLIVIGSVPLFVLYKHPEFQAQLMERLPSFGWEVDKASALRAVTLLALALGGGILATRAPKSLVVIAALVAAAPAAVYLGAPLASEFPGGFAWKSRFVELMSTQPAEADAGWSVVTGYYMLMAAFGLDLLAVAVGALTALVSLRPAWSRASRWVMVCVAASLTTTLVFIVARAIQPLHDATHEVMATVAELTYNMKMFLATLGIVLLLPVGLIDLMGRSFGWRH